MLKYLIVIPMFFVIILTRLAFYIPFIENWAIDKLADLIIDKAAIEARLIYISLKPQHIKKKDGLPVLEELKICENKIKLMGHLFGIPTSLTD